MQAIANYIRSFFTELSQSGTHKHRLFAIATIVSVLSLGYWYGTNDQVVHIPFLAKFLDPALFQGDQFFDLAKYHYSFFWFFFAPFYTWGILEPLLFITHLISMYMTFWVLWELAYFLFKDFRVSILTVLIMMLPHIGFGGFPVIEFNIVNRTVVLPFLLFALLQFFKKNHIRSLFILGILYNFHALSVNFALAMAGMHFLLEWKHVSLKTKTMSAGAFILGALPILVWRLGHSSLDFSVHADWFRTVNLGMLHNVYSFLSDVPYIWILTISGMSLTFLYFFVRSHSPKITHDKVILHCMLGLITIIGVGFLAYHVYPATILVQFQIVRASTFLQLFGYMYGAYYVLQYQKKGKLPALDTYILMLILILSPSVGIFLLALVVYHVKTFYSLKRLVSVVVTIMFISVTVAVAYHYQIWRPEIRIYPEKTQWYDVQVWARNNTPVDTMFITPPYAWGLYELGWHVVSNRPTVVSMQEIMEMSFAPEHASSFNARFQDIAPGAREQFDGNLFHSKASIKKAYESLDEKRLYELAQKYGATYLIVERPLVKNLPIVYQNQGYTIYDIAHPL